MPTYLIFIIFRGGEGSHVRLTFFKPKTAYAQVYVPSEYSCKYLCMMYGKALCITHNNKKYQ